MGIVKATKLIFDYITRDEEDNVEDVKRAINNLNIDITQGDFVAILGHNGSGKSTFAKHLNGILLPTEGTVFISDLDTANDETLLDLRKMVGMVFQNPDNAFYKYVLYSRPGIQYGNDLWCFQIGW